MLFRHPPQSVFPRKDIPMQDILNAQERDNLLKLGRENKINSGKYRKTSNFAIGDNVLIRNFTRNSKFDPYFQYDPLQIIEIHDNGRCLILKRTNNGQLYNRHPDDVKLYNSSLTLPEELENTVIFREDDARDMQDISHKFMYNEYEEYDDQHVPTVPTFQPQGSPIRLRNRNPRYFNDDMTN